MLYEVITDAERIRQTTRTGVSTGVEADDDGTGRLRQVDVGFGDTTDRTVNDVDTLV